MDLVGSIVSLQPPYSLIRRDVEKGNLAILLPERHWRHRLLSDGFWPVERRNE